MNLIKNYSFINKSPNKLKKIRGIDSTYKKMEENQYTETERLGLACSYAALILTDAKKDVTSDGLQKISEAAGIKIDNFWGKVFENVLKGSDISKLLEASLGGGGGGAVAQQSTTTTNTAPTQVQEEEKPVEKEEESAEIGGLFGDDDDDF